MPTSNSSHRAPPPAHQHPHVTENEKVATRKGMIALVLVAAGFLSAPLLILIPYIGFLPAMLAAAGALIAWTGLRDTSRGNGTAVTGLITGVIVFGLLR